MHASCQSSVNLQAYPKCWSLHIHASCHLWDWMSGCTRNANPYTLQDVPWFKCDLRYVLVVFSLSSWFVLIRLIPVINWWENNAFCHQQKNGKFYTFPVASQFTIGDSPGYTFFIEVTTEYHLKMIGGKNIYHRLFHVGLPFIDNVPL